jgi:hypothetical protein
LDLWIWAKREEKAKRVRDRIIALGKEEMLREITLLRRLSQYVYGLIINHLARPA